MLHTHVTHITHVYTHTYIDLTTQTHRSNHTGLTCRGRPICHTRRGRKFQQSICQNMNVAQFALMPVQTQNISACFKTVSLILVPRVSWTYYPPSTLVAIAGQHLLRHAMNRYRLSAVDSLLHDELQKKI